MKKLFTLMMLVGAFVGKANADDTWTLRGSMNGWSATANEFSNNKTTIYLEASSPYTFKLVKNDTYYTAQSTMSWDNCTDWDFNTKGGSNNDCTIKSEEAGQYTFIINTSNEYPRLTVIYPKSNTIYFFNNLGWSSPIAYILGTAYWNETNGAGAKDRYHGITMTKMGESNIWKAEFPSTIESSVVAFLKDRQDSYENFDNTEAVYNSSATNNSLLVPDNLKYATLNTSGKGTIYYNYSNGKNLDGTWFAYPYTRSVTAGNFGTLCLPFDADVTGASVFTITSKFSDENSNLAGINLTSVESIEAGKAYIFKATDNTLSAAYKGSAFAKEAITANGMTGNLSSSPANVSNNNYVIHENQLHKVNGGTATIAQYRAYINLDEISTANTRATTILSLDDDKSGVEDIIQTVPQKEVIFNLQGQRVMDNQKGLLIVNGKKYLNK